MELVMDVNEEVKEERKKSEKLRRNRESRRGD